MSNRIDPQYKELLEHILHFGVDKKDRTGTGVKSIFGWQIRHNMKDGFPLLTTKKMAWKQIVTELLWFLRGDTNIKYLVDNDCHIWDGDAYKNYLNGGDVKWLKQMEVDTPTGKMNIPTPYTKDEFINMIKTDNEFAKKWGELGPIYGKQWRKWDTSIPIDQLVEVSDNGEYELEYNSIDQIQNLIDELKTNPDSRRLMVSAWNVGELDQMVLPPCHYGFQVYTRELTHPERIYLYLDKNPDHKFAAYEETNETVMDDLQIPKRAISLIWNQRSIDTFLGLPFNIASYGLLLMMIADEVNMIPEDLIGSLGDCHLYLNHIEQAKEQISRTTYDLPTVHVRDGIYCSSINDIILKNYQYHPTIKAPLSN